MSSYFLANHAAMIALPDVPSNSETFWYDRATHAFALAPEFASVTDNNIVSHA